jgi:hypothetical protein
MLNFRQYMAFAITRLLPAQYWYPGAYRAAWVLAFRRPYKHTRALSRAEKLNTLLALISRQKQPFPIPIQAAGTALFRRPRPNGLVLCFTHIPLAKLALNWLVEQGFPPTIALAAAPGEAGEIAIWGTDKKVPAVRTGPTVLLKAKSVLQQGGTVSAMVDRYLGGEYSPNIFRLAEKLQADLVFVSVVLEQQGNVAVRFQESAWNGRAGTNRISQQLNELYQITSSIFEHYGTALYSESPMPPL